VLNGYPIVHTVADLTYVSFIEFRNPLYADSNLSRHEQCFISHAPENREFICVTSVLFLFRELSAKYGQYFVRFSRSIQHLIVYFMFLKTGTYKY